MLLQINIHKSKDTKAIMIITIIVLMALLILRRFPSNDRKNSIQN